MGSALRADQSIAVNTSETIQYASRTRFSETPQMVLLGADALPGDGVDANARLSTLACLAPEFAHVERFQMGYRRPIDLPDLLLDEAETSLRASFISLLSSKDREDLVEDARDRLIQWLALRQQKGEADGQSRTQLCDPARGLRHPDRALHRENWWGIHCRMGAAWSDANQCVPGVS